MGANDTPVARSALTFASSSAKYGLSFKSRFCRAQLEGGIHLIVTEVAPIQTHIDETDQLDDSILLDVASQRIVS
ncbi:hypothetical protein EF834_01760 [Rhodococcus spongiicola]|uniref:Uncharacterized protein n=1 Tax=Rhodococcus spongiicola TaxID=2487352 RepID=A0A3S3BPL5_9NOCA|nr:hypothetical protein EF834_01760 [Rhodococcus spongiicola]